MIIATNVRKIIAWAWGQMDLANGYQQPKRRKRRRELSTGFTKPISQNSPLEEAA